MEPTDEDIRTAKPQPVEDALDGWIERIEKHYPVEAGDGAPTDDLQTTDRSFGCEDCNRRGIDPATGRYCRCSYGREKQRDHSLRIKGTYDRAGTPPRLRRHDLEDWDKACGDDPEKQTARSLVAEWIEDHQATGPRGESRPGLLLHGPNGVGKSGLMCSLAQELYEQGFVMLWIQYLHLVRDVQALYDTHAHEGTTAEGRIRTAQHVPVLFLDDLGRPFADDSRYRESEDRRRLFFEILAYRHENELPTFMTCNHDGLADLERQFDSRIADRLMELCTVAEVGGQNLRSPSR